VSEVISGVVKAARAYLNSEVSMEAKLDRQGETVEIDADRSRITQVLSNIVGNATKFTKKGAIKVESNTSIERNFIEIRVSDTGGGIRKEIMPNLFSKFVTSSYKDGEHKGTGLGLYISKSIVEAHKGKIAGFNNNNGGATFVITLPISLDERMLLG
jgi:signal transduction histidine kinase